MPFSANSRNAAGTSIFGISNLGISNLGISKADPLEATAFGLVFGVAAVVVMVSAIIVIPRLRGRNPACHASLPPSAHGPRLMLLGPAASWGAQGASRRVLYSLYSTLLVHCNKNTELCTSQTVDLTDF